MESPHLKMLAGPKLAEGTLLLALTGWMDGGLVSTGTVRRMMEDRTGLIEVARIEPDPFYIYNIPGSMEVAALFRPEVHMDDGLIRSLEMPTNTFHADPEANLAFFIGKEPNLRWQEFADCIFEVAGRIGVRRIIFMGSFGGTVPHTRDPRLFGSVSHAHLRPLLDEYEVRPSDYEGPASFATLLLSQSAARGIEMISVAAEIPGYLQGLNPLSIEAVARRLSKILNQPVNIDAMRRASNEWEGQVSKAVEKDPELAETVRKLEEQYDNELINPGAAQEEGEEEEEGEREEESEEEEE
jgi:proteasome assembly chaperone (PAC2) family protein